MEKYLGVNINNGLTFEKHTSDKVNQTNIIVGLICKIFVSLDEINFKPLFTALVRPINEYISPVWSPYKMKDITTIENVQRRATKLILSLKDLPYSERFKRLNLPTLACTRSRGEMMEMYKIAQGVNDE